MKKEIEDMIALFESGKYDKEQAHYDYEYLLEGFILNYDSELLPLMQKLIALPKNFWYA